MKYYPDIYDVTGVDIFVWLDNKPEVRAQGTSEQGLDFMERMGIPRDKFAEITMAPNEFLNDVPRDLVVGIGVGGKISLILPNYS